LAELLGLARRFHGWGVRSVWVFCLGGGGGRPSGGGHADKSRASYDTAPPRSSSRFRAEDQRRWPGTAQRVSEICSVNRMGGVERGGGRGGPNHQNEGHWMTKSFREIRPSRRLGLVPDAKRNSPANPSGQVLVRRGNRALGDAGGRRGLRDCAGCHGRTAAQAADEYVASARKALDVSGREPQQISSRGPYSGLRGASCPHARRQAFFVQKETRLAAVTI